MEALFSSIVASIYALPLDSASLMLGALFLLLLIAGVGVPLPEEIVLIVGGYLAYQGDLPLWTTMWVLFVGIMVSDMLGYAIGRRYGGWVYTHILGHWKFSARVAKRAEHYFDRYGEAVVFFSRVFSGIRTVVPLLAGHFKFDFKKFLIFDIAATVPWTIALVGASYALGHGLDLITEIAEVKRTVYALVAIAFVAYLCIRFIRSVPDEQ